MLEDSLAQVAGKEKAVRPVAAERGQKPQLSNADVLGLVHHHVIERPLFAVHKLG